jgi:hypothetical protein
MERRVVMIGGVGKSSPIARRNGCSPSSRDHGSPVSVNTGATVSTVARGAGSGSSFVSEENRESGRGVNGDPDRLPMLRHEAKRGAVTTVLPVIISVRQSMVCTVLLRTEEALLQIRHQVGWSCDPMNFTRWSEDFVLDHTATGKF